MDSHVPFFFRLNKLDFKHVLLILATFLAKFVEKSDYCIHVRMRAGVGLGPPLMDMNIFFIYLAGTERTGLCPEVEENPLHSWC